MVNGTLLNFGKKYEDNIRVIFDQWPKLHLGLDALSNQKKLKGIYCIVMSYFVFGCWSLLSLLLLDIFTASLQPTESRSLYSCLIDSALSQTGGPGGPAKKEVGSNIVKNIIKYTQLPNKYIFIIHAKLMEVETKVMYTKCFKNWNKPRTMLFLGKLGRFAWAVMKLLQFC